MSRKSTVVLAAAGTLGCLMFNPAGASAMSLTSSFSGGGLTHSVSGFGRLSNPSFTNLGSNFGAPTRTMIGPTLKIRDSYKSLGTTKLLDVSKHTRNNHKGVGSADKSPGTTKVTNTGTAYDPKGGSNTPGVAIAFPDNPITQPGTPYGPNLGDLGHGGITVGTLPHQPVVHHWPLDAGGGMPGFNPPGGKATDNKDRTNYDDNVHLKDGKEAYHIKDTNYWDVYRDGSDKPVVVKTEDLKDLAAKTPLPDGGPDTSGGTPPTDGSGKPRPLGDVFDGQGGIGHVEEGLKGDLKTLGVLNARAGAGNSSIPGKAHDSHTDPGPDGNSGGGNASFADMKAILSSGNAVFDPTNGVMNVR